MGCPNYKPYTGGACREVSMTSYEVAAEATIFQVCVDSMLWHAVVWLFFSPITRSLICIPVYP